MEETFHEPSRECVEEYSGTPAVMSGLSAYEIQRQRTIEANQKVLSAMGLDKPIIPKSQRPAPGRKRRQEVDPDYKPEPRRTTRVSAHKVGRRPESDSEEESDEEESIPRPRKASKPMQPAPNSSLPEPKEGLCIVVEAAKTARSKCRRCMEMIALNEPRVGMESWMVGRQVMVWQHPSCFLEGLQVTCEASGRGRCKQTKELFEAGERKLSATAHTTTSHFKLRAGAELLRPVLAAISPSPDVGSIAGIDDLESSERQLFSNALMSDAREEVPLKPSEPNIDATPTTSQALGHSSAPDGQGTQPAKGRVTKAKGKVCWRFAGHLCYGTLLSAQETDTHCYARTHKGNTKTLTKGGTSWWMLD